MNRTRRAGTFVLAVLSLVAAAVFTGATPAAAAVEFFVAGYGNQVANGQSYGSVTWHNRTATVSGTINIAESGAPTTVAFEAYAGANKIDTETRTVDSTYATGWRDFTFTIGDPDLVGGFTYIKITIIQPGIGPIQRVYRD